MVMKKLLISMVAITIMSMISCSSEKNNSDTNFKWQIDQFADLKILRYQVPDFDSLSLDQKKLVYYLSQAALSGRDIIWDQNYKYNLAVRGTLDAIYSGYTGDRNDPNFAKFMIYVKRVWFSNGIHHHYSNEKFLPEFSKDYFAELVKNTPDDYFPKELGTKEELQTVLIPIIFNPEVARFRLNQGEGVDMVTSSAVNFYEDVTQKEVEAFYAKMVNPKDTQPVSFGLNSKLVMNDGKLLEKVWKVGGMYSSAIEKIVYWLNKALDVAENNQQKATIQYLIDYYNSGDLKMFDKYNLAWVSDLTSKVDFVNGFIENYGDPLGYKATWESIVNFKDIEATKRAEIISSNAQWFEDNSPTDTIYKKKEVKGVTAKVITVACLSGDCYPSTPIGINLPNADWIRKDYGSKSVTIENISHAYDMAALGDGFIDEFAYSQEEIELAKKYGAIASNMLTDLHECLGHGSGQLAPGVKGDELKNYGSTLEEARADLFALYYIADPKLEELGVMPSFDAAKAEYNQYIRNGLMTQLTRIEPGKNIEEAHMRDRALISQWCYEKGKPTNVIEMVVRDGKSFFKINSYAKLRTLFGQLLREVQRIKSTGDYNAGKNLVESYGVPVNQKLHQEVLARYKKLNLAPYAGFVNPLLTPIVKDGKIVDVMITYPTDFTQQMIEYDKNYSFLPIFN